MKKILILILLALCFACASAEQADFLGKPFPDFSAADTEGNTFTLSEALKEREAAVLVIWSSRCPLCRAEMPVLNELFEAYGDQVAFFALSGDGEDTMETVAAYREANGIRFPMGLDEGRALSGYTGTREGHAAVIVDRFGNAVFFRNGCFMSAGGAARCVECFLGEEYAETAVLTDFPADVSTRAFPVSPSAAVRVENEGARRVNLAPEGAGGNAAAFVVYDDAARLRIEMSAADDPADTILFDEAACAFREVPELYDPERGAYVYDAAMPGADGTRPFARVCLFRVSTGETLAEVFLISGDESIEKLAEHVAGPGHTAAWEYAVGNADEEIPPADAYILYVVDQFGAPVPGVMVNFCTDTACTMMRSDANGTIVFGGETDAYHVQLLKAPAGYGFDAGFEAFIGPARGEWALRVRKD